MRQLVLIFSIILIFTGFTFSQTKTSKTAVTAKRGLKVGDTANDFNLKNIDDTMVSLASIKDAKGYIVIFTCNHCPVAVAYEDRIIELHNKYAPMGYPVVAINPNDPTLEPDDSFEGMKDRAVEKGFPFLYLMDEGQKVYPHFGATKTPHVFILDQDRVVKYIGAIDDNTYDADEVETKYLEDALAAIMKGNNPEPNFTRAVGCGIKDKTAKNKRSRKREMLKKSSGVDKKVNGRG